MTPEASVPMWPEATVPMNNDDYSNKAVSKRLEREALAWLGYCAVAILVGLVIGGLGVAMNNWPDAARIIALGIVGIFATAAVLFHKTDRD